MADIPVWQRTDTVIAACRKHGWQWDAQGHLCHPTDSELSLWRHSTSEELVYSPKLAQHISRAGIIQV